VGAIAKEARSGALTTQDLGEFSKTLKVISNPLNAAILSALMGSSSYPRELALRLGRRESHVSERLRQLERLKLVRGTWQSLDRGTRDHTPKNVKSYTSTVNALKIVIDANGARLEAEERAPEHANSLIVQPHEAEIPPAPVFVGRESELAALRERKEGIAVIVGLPGIGKTTLASHLANRLLLENENSVFWHSLRESDSFGYVIARIASFLERQGSSELTGLIRMGAKNETVLMNVAIDGLVKARALAVFDDYHYCRDRRVTQLIQRMGESRRLYTLVVCRTRPIELYTNTNVREFALLGYSDSEARLFFQSSGISLPPEEIVRINQDLGGHPLALSLVAAKLTSDEKSIHNQEILGFAKTATKEQISKWLQNTLSEELLGLLLALSAFREPVSYEALRRVTDSNLRDQVLLNRVAALVRLGLLTRMGERLVVHDLVREAAHEISPFPTVLHKKVAEYYSELKDGRSTLSAFYHYALARDTEALVRLATRGCLRISEEGYLEPFLHITEELLGSFSLANEGDARLRGWVQLYRAFSLQRLDRQRGLALRVLKEAEAVARAIGDQALEANANLIAGYIWRDLGNISRAVKSYRLGLKTITAKSENLILIAWLTSALADSMVWEGRLEKAIALEAEALKIYEKLGDTRDIAGFTISLGVDYYMQGDYARALHCLQRAKVPPQNWTMSIYLEAAKGLVLGRFPRRRREAIEHLDTAVKICEKTADRLTYLEILSERIILRAKTGDIVEAKKELALAKGLSPQTERKYSLGVLELADAAIRVLEGDLGESKKCLVKAGHLLSSDTLSVGRVLWWKGMVDALMGNSVGSYGHLRKARQIFRKTGATGHAEEVDELMRNLPELPNLGPKRALELLW
jgi:tetratricopeptide (TPR) repeat protein